MKYIIETENLTKNYGTTTVVNKVNLHVPKGQIYGLLGRNGAGKTTVMKMLLQLAFPTDGVIRLFGTNYEEDVRTLYRKIGSIIETPGFYSNLTGNENLQILAKLRGGISISSVEKALQVVGLHKEKRKVFGDYSLGMKQRLGIAAAILHEPELLILDEPINGLDPIGISEIRLFLSKLKTEYGTTIFISSHVLSEIEQIADVIGVMHEGQLIEEADISELHKRNRRYVEYELSNEKIAENILRDYYRLKDYSVQGNTIKIYDFTYSAGEINKTFVNNGLTVSKMVLISILGVMATPCLMFVEALQTHFKYPERIFTLNDIYDNSLLYMMLLVNIMIYVAIILLVSIIGFFMTFHYFKKEDLK